MTSKPSPLGEAGWGIVTGLAVDAAHGVDPSPETLEFAMGLIVLDLIGQRQDHGR